MRRRSRTRRVLKWVGWVLVGLVVANLVFTSSYVRAAVLAGFALLVALVFHGLFSVTESPPVFSGGERTQRESMAELLDQLRSHEHEAFCTFEYTNEPNVWFQVYGRGLSTGNFTCPLTGDLVSELTGLKIAVPDGIEVGEDKTYQNQRVITFDCEPMSPEAWADFINAIFRQVHHLPDDYLLKGWLTEAG